MQFEDEVKRRNLVISDKTFSSCGVFNNTFGSKSDNASCSKVFTRVSAAYTWPLAKNFLPKIITAQSSAMPCNLCIVTAQLRKRNIRRSTFPRLLIASRGVVLLGSNGRVLMHSVSNLLL